MQKCTAFAAASRFLALGTDAGSVHLLDFHGNEIRRFQNHLASVNDISFDSSFDHMASCGSDGSVTVLSLYEEEGSKPNSIVHTALNLLASPPVIQMVYSCPVTDISLDPRYSSAFHKNVCVGCMDGQLFVNTPGWIRGRRDNLLHAHQGPLASVRWRGSYIAWANDKGVKIFNYATGQRLGFVRLSLDDTMRECRCHLSWENDRTLVIAWGKKVKIVSIQDKAESNAPRQEQVLLLHSFTTDYLISGICSLQEFLVILSFDEVVKQNDSDKQMQPVLRIVSRTCEEFVTDVLSIAGNLKCSPADFRLEGVVDGMCYVYAPKDVIAIDLRQWLAWARSSVAPSFSSAS